MNKRVRGIIAVTLVAVMMLGVTACNNKKVITIDTKQFAAKMLEQGNFSDDLTTLEDGMFEELYSDVETKNIVSKEVYVGTGATAEQIVVIEAKDEASATDIKAGLNEKLQYDIEQNRDYLPDEIPKLEKPVLEQLDKYVIMCVSNDNSKIEALIKEVKEQ